MPLYHPRILAQKIEELVLKLLNWSHSATQVCHSALTYQSKMEAQLASESRTAGILAAQLVLDKQEIAQVDARLVAQTAYYVEMKTEVDQICAAVQQAYNEARQVLAYWRAELAKTEQWVISSVGACQHAENNYVHAKDTLLRVREAIERASNEDRMHLREAEAQVSVAEGEKQRAERELGHAQARANRCTSAVISAREAVRLAEEAQQYSQQAANAAGRSHEHIVAAQKACEEGKAALKREEEAITSTEEVLKSAQTLLGDAADSLHTALLHEQSSQAYQAQARVELDGKIQVLVALNQPDYDFIDERTDPLPVDSAIAEGVVGAEVNGFSFLTDSTVNLLEKGYEGPKSDLELRPLIERLLQRRELITSEWWSKLKVEKRVNILRKVHRDIARAYGFPPCRVETYHLRPKLYGMFSEHSNMIIINSNLLAKDHPRQALNTLAHESRHAYQYHATKQYTWTIPVHRRYVVKLWKANWKNYQAGNDGYESYYKQPVEVDARAFADEVVSQMYGGK